MKHPLRHSVPHFALTTLLAALLSGCASGNTTPLPDLKPPSAVITTTPAQQQRAINDLAAKKAEQEAKAVREIQKSSSASSSP